MKILFSADWHIKVGQKNVPRDWQINRYKLLFEKVHELEKNVDIHIIGGDVFDNNTPKPIEYALFFDFIRECNVLTYIYDGNHEATKKGSTFLTHIADACKNINKEVKIIDGIHRLPGIDIIPYTHLKKFKPEEYNNRILCTHVRGNIPPHVVEEIDLSLFDSWDVVLAGDLHSYSNSQRNILYPGSPLAISFHRSPVTNGVIIFDTSTMKHEWIDLKLPQLIRKTVTNKSDIVKTDFDHTIYEVTGNILELSDIDTTSELVDKKIVNKKSNTLLKLENMTIAEELELYLDRVVKLSRNDNSATVKVFNDNYTENEVG